MSCHLARYQADERIKTGIFKFNPEVERIQSEELSRCKVERNNNAISSSLKAVYNAPLSGESLMPYFLDAVKSYATIGEICGVLCEVFGEYD